MPKCLQSPTQTSRNDAKALVGDLIGLWARSNHPVHGKMSAEGALN